MNTKLHIVKSSFNSIVNYSFLIQSTSDNTAIAIDPAWDLDKFVAIISENKLNLEAILLTHSHVDHVNLVGDLANIFNCDVYMTAEEVEYYDFSCKNLRYITNEDSLIVNTIKADVLLTPGHTKGGCTYIIDGRAFTGDTLFIEGCGLCDGYGGDPLEMYNTLQKMKFNFSNDTQIYPGHRYGKNLGLTFEEVMKHNVYLQIDEFEVFRKFRMRKNAKNQFKFI
ncbi:MBL fold metallo-hydrolase [Photobacterium lutimaris]|uniref:MBL fold metallo-hydrolase n=1 Tax=Photobacterium lutimaris TaxID=388278 RepID=A0A2T3J2E4_9GAMM|nr:MBL fold metallo-hydrolase [Photobacterium lutimaris]PSU35477.1 MBL fold metallo-hydrolase [Photobacterium lutimaris]TDR78523.1 glyoxylase-like metal-dependent hydrolase (beta-lactamase superfamily II) [Photobacterium lutimaris]